jgi:hypothetical protein
MSSGFLYRNQTRARSRIGEGSLLRLVSPPVLVVIVVAALHLSFLAYFALVLLFWPDVLYFIEKHATL